MKVGYHGPHLSIYICRNCAAVGKPMKIRQSWIGVLRGLAQGQTNKEIAHAVRLSPGTVKDMLEAIYEEMEFENRYQAAIWANAHIDLLKPKVTSIRRQA